MGNPNLWPLVRHAPFGAPWGGSPGRMGQAAGPHLKLGGDAMCSPRNGETACGDAAPPPRPPLSRSAILGPSPGHPGGARRGGGGGGGPGAGRGGAAGGQAGTRAGTTCAGQGAASRPRARARLRTLVGGPCAPPRPAPGPALPGAVLGAEVLGFPPPPARVGGVQSCLPPPILATPFSLQIPSCTPGQLARVGTAPQGRRCAQVLTNIVEHPTPGHELTPLLYPQKTRKVKQTGKEVVGGPRKEKGAGIALGLHTNQPDIDP